MALSCGAENSPPSTLRERQMRTFRWWRFLAIWVSSKELLHGYGAASEVAVGIGASR